MSSKFRRELLKQMITLATAGFGFVAALAWNEAIQSFVNDFIGKYLTIGPAIVSKFIYAVVITAFAVFVTYQLTKLIGDNTENNKS